MSTELSTSYDDDLSQTLPQVEAIRDAIKGSFFVKRETSKYLPNPSSLVADTTSEQYIRYIAGAEFDEWAGQTQKSMIKSAGIDRKTCELPPQVDYLEMDVDGDGLSLNGAIEQAINNVLAVKWHVGVADYKGLTGVSIDEVSQAEYEQANTRAVIKMYNRESVVKRHFSTINGKKQLSFIMFCEMGYTFNTATYSKEQITSYLILALDEDGRYYQQKIVNGVQGKRDYMSIGNEPMKSLPVVFFADEEIDTELPVSFGFLSPIVDICYYRYRVSADYKLGIRKSAPTTDVFGMDENAMTQFEAVNGRNYYEVGGTNFFNDTDMKVVKSGADASLDYCTKYMADSENKARSIGAVIPDDSNVKTATEAVINFSEQTAILEPIIANVENCFKWLIKWCAMFEGADVSIDDINLSLNREFSQPMLDPQAANAVIALYGAGLTTKEKAVDKLVKLGWIEAEVDELLTELEDTI